MPPSNEMPMHADPGVSPVQPQPHSPAVYLVGAKLFLQLAFAAVNLLDRLLNLAEVVELGLEGGVALAKPLTLLTLLLQL